MMYSMEKCLGQNGTGTPEETELFAGGGESLGQEGVPSEDVVLVSAVTAVSHEIGDILKDELGDAECADRIGADLADLSAELGLLAGLADPDTQQDFPTLLKLAMGGRECESSGSSSSSWSRARGARRPPRPARLPRRRPIAKGKEVSRRRSAAARRAASMRVRRVEVVSDASDVGADSDSDEQWTELDASPTPSGSGSGSSSSSDSSKSGAEVDDLLPKAEPPQLRQFLLPLISNVPNSEQFRIRHEDIVQLLATEEDDPGILDRPAVNEAILSDQPQPEEPAVEEASMFPFEEPPVTTEEEAALLHYVCGGERGSVATFQPTEEWLLGVFHSWFEVSALIYTLIGTDASAQRVCGPWAYRVKVSCHCRLCVCCVRAEPALACLLRDLVWTLAHGGSTVPNAAHIMRALELGGDAPLSPENWDLPRLKRIQFSDEGVTIIHNQLIRYSQQNEMARQVITRVCICREFDKPMEKQYAVERFIRILESYKAAAKVNFKVEIIPLNDDPDTNKWIEESRDKLERYLQPYQASFTAARLHYMATRPKLKKKSMWENYEHNCECLTPKVLCAQQRKQLLKSMNSRMSLFDVRHWAEGRDTAATIASQKGKKHAKSGPTVGELQQGDGTGAKPPDSAEVDEASANASKAEDKAESNAEAASAEPNAEAELSENELSDANAELDDSSFFTVTDSDENSGTASLGFSSSSLDSASELLLAAAHAVDSDAQAAPTQLCRTVRHLMRSIASIERHMDTVLKQCDEWPAGGDDHEARKQVDLGLSAVDRKLMAMYRRLPEVHRRQLQVYRKQKKLSTVCMQLVGGAAPAPPPPGSPPPVPADLPCRALCPEYHLQRFKEVRRKVMRMRDQQLYYHRLRMWLEDQLRQDKESVPESNVTLLDDLQRRKRRTSSPRLPRLSTATKRKLKPTAISKPHRILQLLKHKAQNTQLLNEIEDEAVPPEAFPLEREDNISDADTVVGEKEDMSEVIETLAKMALNPDKRVQQVFAELREEWANTRSTPTDSEEEYPESVSPPLQEMSPTETTPYAPKTRLIVNKFTENDAQKINVPLNARATPSKEDKDSEGGRDPNIYKYVTFGLEIKKAMEECQNIINSYNSIKTERERESDTDGPLSLEQICEVMMSLDKNSAEFLNKIDTDEPIDMNTANTKLAELVENMPQILANMPEIASEFANASFELPEFASIMNSLPEVSSEAQLTPETLKQIRDLKLNKNRDSVKVTKNTAKRKICRRIKNNVDTSDIVGTLTFEFDSADITDLLKNEKELQALMKTKTYNKEEFQDLLFSISAQVVINKVLEYLKASTDPEIGKILEQELFSLPRNSVNAEMYTKASVLFENSVKDSLSMEELRESVKSKFVTWKSFITIESHSIPMVMLDREIDAMLDKFFLYVKELASRQTQCDREKIIEKLEACRKEQEVPSEDECPPPKESLKQITKILSVSVGNTFDLLLMKMSRMTGEKRAALKNMRIKYVDVLKRCAESQQLVCWILSDPDLAASHIQELMGFGVRAQEKTPDFSTMPVEKKRAYFMDRLKAINKHFMDNIPRKSVTGDEWLVMLYRLEQFESKIKESLVKYSPPVKTIQNASEAEILAAKGLSKIIGKANAIKKEPVSQIPAASTPVTTDAVAPATSQKPVPPVTEPKPNQKKREVIIKCEALIAKKGNKVLKDSFDAIKSYLAGEVAKPEDYQEHVMAIVTNLDYSALDEEMVEVLRFGGITISPPATNENTIKVNVPAHDPEELAKYSAQALRNAKQTLNNIAFQKTRNGQSKSESDVSSCDVPSSECKYTSDCMCTACKRDRSICLGDIVKISFDPANPEKSTKTVLEEKKKEVKEVKVKTPAKAKAVPKQCENAHQQHVCKVGHTNNGNGSCTGDGNDQHCTCCYCTVFGHAPPLTTPVPRNFNETRERLRLILSKKKQLCKTANGDQNSQQDNKTPQPDKKQSNAQTQASAPQTNPPQKLVQAQPKPPALPKTLPPNLTAQAQAKRQALDTQQRMLADKMAKMVVTEKPEMKNIALQRTMPVHVNVPPGLKAEGKVNPNAMEQIRLQQLKQQQQQAQYQQQMAQQTKPEPIYDLPIHNKPPQQQLQIRQEFQKQQFHKQLLLQQKVKHNPVIQISPPIMPQNPPVPITTPQQAQQVQQTPPKPTTQPQVQQKPPQLQQAQQLQQKPVQMVQQTPQKAAVQPQIQQRPQQVQQNPSQQLQQVQQRPPHQQQMQQVQQRPPQQQQMQQVQQRSPQQQQMQQVQQRPPQQQQMQQVQQRPPQQQQTQQVQQRPPQQQQTQQVQQRPPQQQQTQQVQQRPPLQQQTQQVQQRPPQQAQQVQQKPPQSLSQLIPQLGPQQQAQRPQAAPQNVRVTPQLQKPTQLQLLQKPPLQQAPRKPPPQELQQKLAQKQQTAQQKPAQTQQTQTPQPQVQQQLQQTQQQQLQQQQLRQQQQQQQQCQQQRQGRQPNQNSVSLSSRDTSVFSTSSGCSDGSCWQGRPEDTRDLDALLQYIEGPSRTVDRMKKKAKKQRQKAKKTEERLSAECTRLKIEYARVRFEAEALRVAHYSAKRRCEETRKTLQLTSAHTAPTKNRKKPNKLTPAQKQQVQVLAEQVGELTALMNTTARELKIAESEVADCSQRLRKCEKEINEARYVQGKKTPVQLAQEELRKYQNEQIQEQLQEQKQLLQQQKLKLQQHEEAHRLQSKTQWLLQQQQQQELQERQRRQQQQLQMHQLKQQRQLQMEQELMNRIRIDEAKLLKQRQNEAIANADRMKTNGVSSDRGVSSSSTGSVSSTGAERGGSSPASADTPPVDNRHIVTKDVEQDEKTQQKKSEAPRKQTQTWEQALAHINQVAKGTKEKKKQKAAPEKAAPEKAAPEKADPKPKETKPAAQEEAPVLSKKQRKKLAQQQAEEEEKLQQEALQKQEAQNKKSKKEPATPEPKVEPLTKKAEKKLEQAKRAEEAKSKKEAKRERKLEKKAEKKEEKKAKEKENKPEKNVPAPVVKPSKQPTPPPLTKKERKKEQQLQKQEQKQEKPPVVNITPHTTIEAVNKKNASAPEAEKASSCSIMEQLSSGIQVSELRLPPGITLTRVHPNDKKDPPPIKSVPLWKANQLPVPPTPVARPVPVINADPSMMMFSPAHPEPPPKPTVAAEPPPVMGKSKKAKKKAKKVAASDEKPEGTKMVTLRNPMFHPNLPPVQISNSPPVQVTNPKKPEISLPDPIPMPPNACQATITPTSNGMYTIRNPLMSMMHQQSMMGVRNPTPPFTQPVYNYSNPNYNQPGYVLDPEPTQEYQNRIMNLASFTQKNDDEGYSLFKTRENPPKSFLTPEYYNEETGPKPVVSPNPIGTRPEVSRFEDNSLFTNTQRPEPIGTPLKREESNEYKGLYTPFGVENPLFRNALFNEKTESKVDETMANGDLPYFQRLRVGSKLNNEVTIHHVTESKFYRQEPTMPPLDEIPTDDSLFCRPVAHGWPESMYPNPVNQVPRAPSDPEPRFGAVGTRPHKDNEPSIFLPDASKRNISSLEACEREMESFKRFEQLFSPPEHKPKV